MKAQKQITLTQAAAVLQVSRQRAHQLARSGRLQGAAQLYPGGPWLVTLQNGKVVCPKGKPGRKKAAK